MFANLTPAISAQVTHANLAQQTTSQSKFKNANFSLVKNDCTSNQKTNTTIFH